MIKLKARRLPCGNSIQLKSNMIAIMYYHMNRNDGQGN